MRRAAIALLVVAAHCDGQSASSGAYEPLRVRGAQFIPGPLPGSAPGSNGLGPKLTNVSFANRTVLPGQAGKAIDGRVQSNATSVAMRLNDLGSGYWVVVTGPSDSLFPGESDWHADGDYNIDFATAQSGNHPIRFVAIDGAGNAGEQVENTLCFSSKLPDNGHSCEPTARPPDAVITLEWDQNVDLDLQVVTPDTTVEPKHPSTALNDAGTALADGGGLIDRDSLVACVPDGRRQEDLVWQKRPTGKYDIYANLFDACGKLGASFVMTVCEAEGDMPNRALVAKFMKKGRVASIEANGGSGTGSYLTTYEF